MIDKILKQIIDKEQIRTLGKAVIEEIRSSSNKDLRNSIQTLQFYSAGRKSYQIPPGSSASLTSPLKKIKKSTVFEKKLMAQDFGDVMDGDCFLGGGENGDGVGGKKKAKKNGRGGAKSEDEGNEFKPEKDNMFTIFHALGKFLYNKSK